MFLIFGVFAAAVFLWVLLRLPETLHPEYRLTLTTDHIVHAVGLVLGNRNSLCYTLAMTVMFGSILAYVGMVPQIFEEVFHRPGLMPAIFALCASSMGVTAFLNSRIVERVGMRIISHLGLLVFIGITGVHVLIAALGLESLWTFVILQSLTMACLGLTASNFGAMAMEPVGSVAGIGASLQGFISTFGGAVVGALIGRRFNGATLPLATGAFACGLASLLFVLLAEHWRLFRPHHAGAAMPRCWASDSGPGLRRPSPGNRSEINSGHTELRYSFAVRGCSDQALLSISNGVDRNISFQLSDQSAQTFLFGAVMSNEHNIEVTT